MTTPASHRLWSLLDPSVSRIAALSACTGLPVEIAWQIQVYAFALSPEFADLLEAMPALGRALSCTTVSESERCVGHLRGPVRWSETMTAWSSGLGVDDVFVCAIERRDFNLPENRLLVGLLDRVIAAGPTLHSEAAAMLPQPVRTRLATKIAEAKTARSRRVFRGIPVQRRLNPKDLRDARHARHQARLAVVFAAEQAITTALDQRWMYALSDEATRIFHKEVLAWAIQRRESGLTVPRLRVADGALVFGTEAFWHPTLRNSPLENDEFSTQVATPPNEPAMSENDAQSAALPFQRSGSYSS